MNKKIIISLLLLVGLAGLAVFINFTDKSVDAAYLGSGLPSGSANETLRYNGGWEPSNILLISDSGVTSGITVNGDIGASGAISADGSVTAQSFIYTSDASLKENVKLLNNSLDKIERLEGVSFTWKKNGVEEIGLIAQDVEKVLPELVVTSEDGLKAVKYGNIVALLIEAVKEQQAEINELRVELDSIK